MKKLYTFVLCAIFSLGLMAQGSITGKIMDADNGEPLFGAAVYVKGTVMGTVSDFDGSFMINDVPSGTYDVEISYLGFATQIIEVTVDGNKADMGDISMASEGVGLQEVLVVADVAIDRRTPVAVSTISTEEIETKIGSQELPELLRRTPSIYATKSGGGYGDARINVRGFNQRNTAVLINGIPVNDMENGWVYWSNWAGLSDVTRSMQVQRGLGASKLAISSVGGTVNIVTRTVDQKKGGSAFATMGNDGFLKAGLTYSTGKLSNGMAVTVSGSRTQGDGYIDATYIDAWSYFASIAKEFGTNHQLVFTAIGAPQKHGQRSFRERLTKYVGSDLTGANYAKLIRDSKVSDFDERQEINGQNVSDPGNIRYNSDWGFDGTERYNIRENFYHKPQMALNHYWNVSDNKFLSTSAYLSFGRGGGTGDRGSIGGRGTWGYRDANGLIRVSDIRSWNTGGTDIDGFPAEGKFLTSENTYISGERDGLIKRASMNSHNWMGILSKLDWDINDNLSLTTGIDLRSYKGLHYRKVVDLLGTDAWLEPRDVNDKGTVIDINGDGDTADREEGKLVTTDGKLFGNPGAAGKINYDNDGLVGWLGAFAELEWSQDNTTLFLSGSVSNTSYEREDRFNYLAGSEDEVSDKYSFRGYNLKGGANYNVTDNSNLYGNIGFYSKAPIFDVVYPFFNNVDVNPDAPNEKVFGAEAGYGYRTGSIRFSLNTYYTRWSDKSLFTRVDFSDGSQGFANVQGLNALHTGVELEGSYYVNRNLTLNGSASFNNWEWQNNVNAKIADDDNVVIAEVDVFAKGLKVGDAPQTQWYIGADYGFDNGLSLDAGYQFFSRLYTDFDPADRTDAAQEGIQALQLPDYGLLDVGAAYKFQISGYDVRIRANMNNVLDELYVAEARDASSLDRASGFFGFGRTWNVGVKFWF